MRKNLPRVQKRKKHPILKRRKPSYTDHILRRNCLQTLVIEGKIEGRKGVNGRRGSRRKKLLDNLMGTRTCRNLKKEALDRTMWITSFVKGHGRVVTYLVMVTLLCFV